MFDNETGKHVAVDWLEDGDWYEDAEGMLYIIPAFGAVAEIEGPDGETCDLLNGLCRAHQKKNPPAHEVEALGLKYVPDFLKRFDPQAGYYHA